MDSGNTALEKQRNQRIIQHMTRLSQSDAYELVRKHAASVCNFVERIALDGPLKQIMFDLYRAKGGAGRYDADEATQIFVSKATALGYPASMVHGKISAVVTALYNSGFHAGLDANGFYLGHD
jgi:hypothetical protein